MKKNRLRLEKFTVSKLKNPQYIKGGDPGDDGTETRDGDNPPPPPPCDGFFSFLKIFK